MNSSTDQSADNAAVTGQACPVSGTDIHKSLVVTDAAILKKFTFARTFGQLLSSSGSTSQTGGQVFQQWMSTFGPTDCTNPKVDPNHYGEVCPRNNEFLLAGVDPTDPTSEVQFDAVGLFNRFDLAPTNGDTCGEYRIVYAMHSTDPQIAGRGFIIFEAALPNPNPALKAKGCLPIAEFWQNLTNDTSVSSRSTKLQNFYYNGTAIPGVGPVVDAHNYGLALNGGVYTAGQIRTNMFINFFQWHLREFKTDLTCPPDGSGCTLAIDHVSVKTNPANELFEGTAKKSAAFLTAFPKQVKALSSTGIATIGMTIADQYNEYESVSQGTDVDYDNFTDSALRSAITNQLGEDNPLTVDNILLRATTQTCGGCHEQSNGADIGPRGQTWPPSLGFVQIDESSDLSPALVNAFLPHRLSVLEDYINKLCGGAQDIQDDGLTLGGSQIGAAN